jgi:putative acetyltransferase
VTDIVYIRADMILGWREACEAVAAERLWLGRIALPPLDLATCFPMKLIRANAPMYVAVDGGRVVGWADIAPVEIPECAHRGNLGMGVIASHRGAGLGGRLLEACLDHAPRSGIEKVELTVYASNAPAIALYRRFGFTRTGVLRDWRRLDGVSWDALLMEKFLQRPGGES